MKNIPFNLPVEVDTFGGVKLAIKIMNVKANLDTFKKLQCLGISNDIETDHIVNVSTHVLRISQSGKAAPRMLKKYKGIVSVQIEITTLG